MSIVAGLDHPRHDSSATLRANVRVLSVPTKDVADLLYISNQRQSDDFAIAKPSTAPLPVPTKENDWLGFCQSAIKLQNGDRKGALKKRTDYGAAFAASGVTTYYCSSKGCAYQGHVSVDFVWKTVMKDDRLGLKIRWAFLAKSHIRQTMVTGRQYQFQCPICIYTHGHAEGRVWKGVDIYVDHVSSHRGKEIPPEVLQKLNIVNDRVTEDKDDFDINLYPTVFGRMGSDGENTAASSRSSVSLSRAPTRDSIVGSIWSRKQSNIDIGSGLQRSNTAQTWRSERADSVVGGAPIVEEEEGPWSEGLSDFKPDREEDYLSPDF